MSDINNGLLLQWIRQVDSRTLSKSASYAWDITYPIAYNQIFNLYFQATQANNVSVDSATIISCITYITNTTARCFVRNNSSGDSAKTYFQQVLLLGI